MNQPPHWQQPQHPQQHPSQQLPYPPQQGYPPQGYPQQQPPPQQQWRPGPQQQYGPQPHGPQQQRPPQGPPGAGPGTHVKRAIDWNVAQVMVAPKEKHALEAAGVFDRLQGLFAWRRSSLLVALPVLVLSVVLGVVSAAGTEGTEYFTPVGNLVLWLPVISLAAVPVGCMLVLARWTELRKTSRTLQICWIASIVVPLLCALAPVDVILDIDQLTLLAEANGRTAELAAGIETVRLELAVNYAVTLLPVVLSVAGGMLKGAARTKSLFPSSGLPGWFLVAIAPLYSIFVVVMFGLIEQLAGNLALLAAVALLAFSPWLFVIYRKVYSRPLSLAEARGQLANASRIGGFVMWGAIFFVVIFVFTGQVRGQDVVGSDESALFTFVDVVRATVEVIARGVVTSVVFSTIFLGMIFSEWRTMTGMREDIRREHNREMRGLERYVTDPRNGYGDTVLSGAPVQPQQPPR